MIAPNVISSPWAKLVSPVVPKIIDRPRAAIASSAENTRPPTASCIASTALPAPPGPASPIGKVTDWSLSRLIGTVRVRTSGSVSAGREPSDSLTVKDLPSSDAGSPGRSTMKVPSASLVASPITAPDSSSTVTSTPSTPTWGDSRRSQIRPRTEIVSSSVGSGSAQAVALPDVGAVADVDADATAAPPAISAVTSSARSAPIPTARRGRRVCMVPPFRVPRMGIVAAGTIAILGPQR